ncbi:MAG: RidA family protein [Syntrophomonas sp.]
MDIENRLKELGIVIPAPGKPVAAYVPGVKAGEFIYISGQLPIKEGKLLYCGKLGRDLNIEEGQAAGRLAALNCLGILKSFLDKWEQLGQIVKLTGFIQSMDTFQEQAAVLNGASELLEQVLGERGKHARVAVGVNSLPLNAACEIEMIAQLK